jgi:GDP-mannose transporter
MVSPDVLFAIGLYSASSSLMLIMNKLALKLCPLHSTVTACQLAFCTAVVLIMSKTGLIEGLDGFESHKVRPYILYILGFTLGIYTNMRALADSNIETVIVFRACVPITVAVLDYVYLGRDLPNKRSTGALLMIVIGALGYVSSDEQFATGGWVSYTWPFAYFCTMCFQMTYGKYIIKEVKMNHPVWGAVLYTNTIGIVPELIIGFVIFNEGSQIPKYTAAGGLTGPAAFALFVSCVLGTVISYAGFNCRNVLSATSFTVVGVMNKMITVLINLFIWDNHASWAGILWLCVCIGAGTVYREAPMRPTITSVEKINGDNAV